jgi:hypothetical protein
MVEIIYKSVIGKDAIGFQPVRFLVDGSLKHYDLVIFNGEEPNVTVENIYCQMKRLGGIETNKSDAAGRLSMLDKKLNIIDYIPLTKKGLIWIYKKYNLRVM